MSKDPSSCSLYSSAEGRRRKQLFTMGPYLLEPPPSPDKDLHHVFKLQIVHDEEEELQTCVGESNVENPRPLPSPEKDPEQKSPVGVISLSNNRKLPLPPRSQIISSTPKALLPVLVLEDLFKEDSPVRKRGLTFHGSTVFQIKEDATTTDVLIFNTSSLNPEPSQSNKSIDEHSSLTRSTENSSEESTRQGNAMEQSRASPLRNSPCADINTKEYKLDSSSLAIPRNSKPDGAEVEKEMPKDGGKRKGRERQAVDSPTAPTSKPSSDDERPNKRLQSDSFQSASVNENGSSPVKKAKGKKDSSSRETPNSDCDNGKESCKNSSTSLVNQGKSDCPQELMDSTEPSNGDKGSIVTENSPMRRTDSVTANELCPSQSDDDEPAPSTKRRKFSKTKKCLKKSSNSSSSESDVEKSSCKKSPLIKLKNTVSSSSSSDSSGKSKSSSPTTTTKSPSVSKAGTPSAKKTSALLIRSKSLVSSASKQKTSSSSSTDSSDDEITNNSSSAVQKPSAKQVKKTSALPLNSKNSDDNTSISLSGSSDDEKRKQKSSNPKISEEALPTSNNSALVPSESAKEDINSSTSSKSKSTKETEPPLKEDTTSSSSDFSDERSKSLTKKIKKATSSEVPKKTPKETPLSKSSSDLPKKSKKMFGSKKMDVSSTSSGSTDSSESENEKRRSLLSVTKMKHASSKVSKEVSKQSPSTKKTPSALPMKSLAPSKKVDTTISSYSKDEKRRRLLIMTQKFKSSSTNAITKEKKTQKGLLGENTNVGTTKVSTSKSSSSRNSVVEVCLSTSDSDDPITANAKSNEPNRTITISSESSITDSEDTVEEVPVRKRARKDVVPRKNTMQSLQNDILRRQANSDAPLTSGRFVEDPVYLRLGKVSRKFFKPALFLRPPRVDDPNEEEVTRRREERADSHPNFLPLDSVTSSSRADTSSSTRDNLSTWELLIQSKSLPGKDFWEDILKDEDCKVNEAHFSHSTDEMRCAHVVYRDPKFSPDMKISKRVIGWILKEHGSMDVSPLNAFCPLHSRMTPDAHQLLRSRFPLLRRSRPSPEEMGIVRQNLKKLMVELDLTPESARGLMKEIIDGAFFKMKVRYYLGCFAGQGILDRRLICDVYKWIASLTISTGKVEQTLTSSSV